VALFIIAGKFALDQDKGGIDKSTSTKGQQSRLR
jgi:hypothetical protein